MVMSPRMLHEIWKEKDGWKVQAPHGRMTFKSKRQAEKWVEEMTKAMAPGRKP